MVTDYNTNAYMYPDQMIRAGGDIDLMQDKQPSASGEVVTASTRRPSEERLRISLFTVVNSSAMNGMGEGIVYRDTLPPWQTFMYAVDAAAAARSLIAWGALAVRKWEGKGRRRGGGMLLYVNGKENIQSARS